MPRVYAFSENIDIKALPTDSRSVTYSTVDEHRQPHLLQPFMNEKQQENN